jgi:hypothetical protein
MAPKQMQMDGYTALNPKNSEDPRVGYYHTDEAVPGTNTTFAVFAPKNGKEKLPVLLFQSGYGNDSAAHYAFFQRIAAEGYLVIAPDRSDDMRCGVCGLIGFLSFCSCSAMTTDGSNLKLALEYVKNPKNEWMDRADLSKLTVGGFSMGSCESVHAKARFPSEFKAVMFISPSIMVPTANAIQWNCCCYPLSGGSCTCCSDTPVSLCGEGAAIRAFNVPTLIVTSDLDTLIGGSYRAADILGDSATLVTLKDSAIDITTPTINATSSWGSLLAMGCCVGSPFYGMKRHFAIAEDADGTVSALAVAFLKQVYSGTPMESTDQMVNDQLNSRAETSCCVPFPLFKSCFES